MIIDHYLSALRDPFVVQTPLPDLKALPKTGPKVLIFSPHPDDETIIGTLPLRLRRERHAHVVNLAITLGSSPDRRAGRRRELARALDILGFEGEELGFTGVTTQTRNAQSSQWNSWVQATARLIEIYQPDALFLPHEDDGHPAHTGTYHLAMDALGQANLGHTPHLFLTEWWHPMLSPNLMVECSPTDLNILLSALAAHEGEVSRNPYHRSLPAWMIDNTRRGAERIQGAGAGCPNIAFSTLYRFIPGDAPPLGDLPTIFTALAE